MTANPDYETWYDELLTAAVLGVDRRPPPASPFDAIGDHDAHDAALLDQAAPATALVRGGRTAVVAEPVEPAPAESRPTAPPRADELLGVLLDAPPVGRELRAELLLRWLDAAARSGTLVAPARIPVLAAHAGHDVRLRAPLRAVWGSRGEWLVAHGVVVPGTAAGATAAASSTTTAAGLAERWSGLTTSDAVQALAALRAVDPAGARQVAVANWKSLPAGHKQSVLAALETGLGPDDESLLEAALDERSARVRAAAAEQLRRLPSSAFAARMGARLAGIVDVDRTWRGVKIGVRAPENLDDAAARDGLSGTDSEGARVDSLKQIVAAAPLGVWTARTATPPEKVIAALDDDASMRAALIRAAVAQRDSAWALALLSAGQSGELLGVLSPADAEQYLLRTVPSAGDQALRELLTCAPRPWTNDVARVFLRRLTRPAPGKQPRYRAGLSVADVPALPESAVGYTRELLAQSQLPGSEVEIDDPLRKVLTTAVSFHAFDRSIQESFS
ncbi:MAG: DUF5691 domain-containing protein [Gordonia sp. (in: high G+C Gram-positive bacteria)]